MLGAIKDRPEGKDETIHKIRAFRRANIKVLDHIGYIGDEMKTLLETFNSQKYNKWIPPLQIVYTPINKYAQTPLQFELDGVVQETEYKY